MVIWITGLSGAGKTTFSQILVDELKQRGITPFTVDGDQVRAIVGDQNTGHDPASRLVNAERICRMALEAENQGHVVVVSTMSLFHQIHEWNRKNFKKYYEIFIDVDLETLKKNDSKGIYAKHQAGKEQNVGGVDLPVELPKNPHITLNNQKHSSDLIKEAKKILNQLAGDLK